MPRWPRKEAWDGDEATTTTFTRKDRKPLYDALDALTDDQFKSLINLLRTHSFPTGDKHVR